MHHLQLQKFQSSTFLHSILQSYYEFESPLAFVPMEFKQHSVYVLYIASQSIAMFKSDKCNRAFSFQDMSNESITDYLASILYAKFNSSTILYSVVINVNLIYQTREIVLYPMSKHPVFGNVMKLSRVLDISSNRPIETNGVNGEMKYILISLTSKYPNHRHGYDLLCFSYNVFETLTTTFPGSTSRLETLLNITAYFICVTSWQNVLTDWLPTKKNCSA